MEQIRGELRVITPLFMGGSNRSSAEFRITSLLGALRFWYRATAPSRLVNDPAKLHEAEAAIFGSSEGGQSAFLTRVDTSGIAIAKDAIGKDWRDKGSGYLGYGVINAGRVMEVAREYIKPGSALTVSFIFRPKRKARDGDKEEAVQGLTRAVMALGLLGGLGSRSRRGFGSVALASLTSSDGQVLWTPPKNRQELQKSLEQLLGADGGEHLTEKEPSYTAFSQNSRVIITGQKPDPLQLLDSIGKEMMRYRSYGHLNPGTGEHELPWGERAEQNFSDDHDLVFHLQLHQKTDHPPRRVAFGLPHNYRFSSPPNRTVYITSERCNRRGSPLFIHIHPLSNSYSAVLSYLPAMFLPDNDQIKMKLAKGTVFAPAVVDGRVINDFLDRFADRLEVSL